MTTQKFKIFLNFCSCLDGEDSELWKDACSAIDVMRVYDADEPGEVAAAVFDLSEILRERWPDFDSAWTKSVHENRFLDLRMRNGAPFFRLGVRHPERRWDEPEVSDSVSEVERLFCRVFEQSF